MTIAEHDRVRLTEDIAENGEILVRGAEGAVVSVYREGKAYAVEFVAGRRQPIVATVHATQLEPVQS